MMVMRFYCEKCGEELGMDSEEEGFEDMMISLEGWKKGDHTYRHNADDGSVHFLDVLPAPKAN